MSHWQCLCQKSTRATVETQQYFIKSNRIQTPLNHSYWFNLRPDYSTVLCFTFIASKNSKPYLSPQSTAACKYWNCFLWSTKPRYIIIPFGQKSLKEKPIKIKQKPRRAAQSRLYYIFRQKARSSVETAGLFFPI